MRSSYRCMEVVFVILGSIDEYLEEHFIVSGLPKPVSVEQKVLFGMVLGFVQKFLPAVLLS